MKVKLALEVAKFMFGFLPWLLFLFLPTDGWEPLRRAVLICFLMSLLSWKDLKNGFILQWASSLFFLFCLLSFYAFKWIWLAENMGVIANTFLAAIIWISILIRQPFTLQYARLELSKEHWNDESLVKGCQSIAIFWGALLLIPVAFSIFKICHPRALPEAAYFWQSIICIIIGVSYTTYFKQTKKKQREAKLISGYPND